MADLKVNFGTLELKNPLIAASAITTKTVDRCKKAEAAGIGAIIAKSIVARQPYFGVPRFYTAPRKRGLFCPMDMRIEEEDGLDYIRALKKEIKTPIIASAMGLGRNLDSWVDISKKMAAAGADMLELNLGCPNIGLTNKNLGQKSGDEEEVMGAIVGQSPSLAGKITRAVTDEVKIPVMVKLTPEAGDITAVALAVLENGAAALDVSNSPMGIPGVDIYDHGKPLFKNLETQAFCGVVGPFMKPFTLKNVAQIKMVAPEAEILASGGLMNWTDTVEVIMCGARAASYCTVVIWEGWEAVTKIEKGLAEFMDKQGYEKLDDIYALALQYFTTSDKMALKYVVAEVDPDKCVGCGVCVKPGHCEAVVMKDEIAFIDKSLCVGCAACAELCPAGAIAMKEDDEHRAKVMKARKLFEQTH